MGDQRRVILVGCGQRKLTHAAPARVLTGPLAEQEQALLLMRQVRALTQRLQPHREGA